IERTYDMPVQAWSSLYAAARFPGIRAKEIAQLFPRPQNTISRALSLLEGRAWVRQEPSATDKREKHVYATDAGRKALAAMTAAAVERQEELFSPLSDDERDTFLRLAAKIAQSDTLLASAILRKD
ncbi:MAG: MarR family transcriptional regulator, partial [Pseudomonadota bacterium]